MDADSGALMILPEDNESRDDLLVNQNKSFSTSPVKESELQHSQTTPLRITYPCSTNYEDDVIAAVPLSYKLPEQLNFSTPILKIEYGRASGQSTNSRSRRRVQPEEQPFSRHWDCQSRQRTNGKWDKYYYHKTLNIMCRSWKEVERFEIHGIRPGRRGKAKEKKSPEEEVNKKREAEKMQTSGEKSAADADNMKEKENTEEKVDENKREEKRMRTTVEKFQAYTHYSMEDKEVTEEQVAKNKRDAEKMQPFVKKFLADARAHYTREKQSTEEEVARREKEAKQMRSTVEKFLAEAYYNFLHNFDNQQDLSEDSEKTPLPDAI